MLERSLRFSFLLVKVPKTVHNLIFKCVKGENNRSLPNFIFLCRFSKSQIYTDKNVFERGGDPVVPAARRVTGLHGVLNPHRHVGRRLYILRDGVWSTPVPGLNRGR